MRSVPNLHASTVTVKEDYLMLSMAGGLTGIESLQRIVFDALISLQDTMDASRPSMKISPLKMLARRAAQTSLLVLHFARTDT